MFIEYSIERDAVLCYPCRLFGKECGYAEDTFVRTGFRNWKKMKKIESHSIGKVPIDTRYGSTMTLVDSVSMAKTLLNL